jgi:hypothetical protein
MVVEILMWEGSYWSIFRVPVRKVEPYQVPTFDADVMPLERKIGEGGYLVKDRGYQMGIHNLRRR